MESAKAPLADMLAAAKARWEVMSVEEKEAVLRKQRDGWVRAETQWAKDFKEGKCDRD